MCRLPLRIYQETNYEMRFASRLISTEADFTRKRVVKDGRSLPQAIAHRGHEIHRPETSLQAFEDAIEAGAHAVETDVRLTKNGVVVLSHVCFLQVYS